MIDQALSFTESILNQFFKNRFSLDENAAVLNAIIDADGSIPLKNQNKVVVSLINVEEETLKPFMQRNTKLQDGSYVKHAPIARYNLEMLITSNFDDYNETLKFLNAAILFFQSNAVVTSANYSSMPKSIEKLEFDLEKLDYHQMHNLWSAMGAKYQPSVIYKIRLVTLDSDEAQQFMQAITKTQNQIKP